MKYIPQRIELADGTKCVALEDYDKLATENMLEVNKLCNQRDAAMDVLSDISRLLNCELCDENTTAKEYGARIRVKYEIEELTNMMQFHKICNQRDAAIKELKEAWLAMDEIEGTDRMNEWQNKNAHFLNIDT